MQDCFIIAVSAEHYFDFDDERTMLFSTMNNFPDAPWLKWDCVNSEKNGMLFTIARNGRKLEKREQKK